MGNYIPIFKKIKRKKKLRDLNIYIPFLNLFAATAPINNTNDVWQRSTNSEYEMQPICSYFNDAVS